MDCSVAKFLLFRNVLLEGFVAPRGLEARSSREPPILGGSTQNPGSPSTSFCRTSWTGNALEAEPPALGFEATQTLQASSSMGTGNL